MRTARCTRLAVIGLGRIGRLHADNLAHRVRGAKLAAVVDPLEPLAREIGVRYGVTWGTALDAVLTDGALDGVVIAAPTAVHQELVRQVAAAGLHVFCEKPVGLDVQRCAEAVASAAAAGVALQVGFQRRFDPDWRWLKSALERGTIGALDLLRCSHRNAERPGPATALGDVFADVVVHDLDAALWIGGEVVELYAAAAGNDVEAATVSLRFASGALGLVDVHRHASYGFECSAELVGSLATARCGYSERRGGTELLRDGRATADLGRDHGERHSSAYVAELEHFGEVASGAATPIVSGADAVAALRLAELAARSSALGASLAVAEHAGGAV